jgi:predicted N-acyltransferase
VEADLSGSRLDDFLSVYLATMKRCGAAPSYFFPKAFFEAICTDLKGHYAFFHMMLGSKVIASELVLLSQDQAYSFLGGSFEEAFELRCNEFLKHESFLWCRSAGMRGIVLGGGYRGEDGILQFKRGFAPEGEVPFNLGVAVYDPILCARLAEQRQIYEQEHNVDWKPRPRYFPPYRA